MMELVSVIVPAYNVASKIERCLTSLCKQSYPSLEIIVIDDGSTDGTTEEVQKVAKQDERIRCITQENKGVAAARNKGLEAARGVYIAFCDGDDYVHPDYIRKLTEGRKLQDADWVISGFCKVIQGKLYHFAEPYGKESHAVSDGETFFKEWYKNPYIPTVWGKLYKRQLIKETGICFPEHTEQGEDIIFNIRYATNCNCVCAVNRALYYYEENETSLTKKRRNDVWENQSDIFAEFCELTRKRKYPEQCVALFFARGILVALGHAAETKWEIPAWEKLCKDIRGHAYFGVCVKYRTKMDWFAKTVVWFLEKKMDRCAKLLYEIKLFGYCYMRRIYYRLKR